METYGSRGADQTDKTIGRLRISQSSNAPRIRRARPEDCEAILKAHEASVSTLCAGLYTAAQIAAWVNQRQLQDYRAAIQNALVLVCETEQEIIGFAELDRISGMIHAIYVNPDWIGEGVGRELLAELEVAARTAGLRRVRLNATLNSVAFLQGGGFLPLGETNQALSDGIVLPCVEMQKWL